MRTDGPVFGEQSFSKVAALYADELSARAAAARVRDAFGLAETQVRVVTPDEPHPGHKIEPESRGILRTLIKAHITFGLLGLLAGLVLFAVLWGVGLEAVRSSPWFAGVSLAMFGIMFGLLAGGLVTLRPDHDKLIVTVMEAIAEGRYAVVAHPVDRVQREKISTLLAQTSGEVVGTL